MPVIPNFLERLMLVRLNKGPAAILDLFGAASFESVALALRLNLFETLAAAGPLSAKELAGRTGTNREGLVRLCEFLIAEGYLAKEDDGFRLTSLTEKWLISDADTNIGPYFTFWDELGFPFWDEEFETAVMEGAPSQTIYEWCDEEPGRWEVAQAGFRSAAELLVDDVVDSIQVPDGAERVVDVGGGHGLYTFELCRRYPDLSATIFDLSGAVDAISVPEELRDRVDTVVGDYRTDEIGEGFDLALLFNVIHAQDGAENTELFGRVADALGPEGRIVLLDQWSGPGRTPVGRAYLKFFALTYLTTLNADIYDFEEAKSWLEDAGFGRVRSTSIGPLSGQAIVEATKVV